MTKTESSLLPTWLLWLAATVPLLGFWLYGLTDLDEGFYAAVVNDMLRRGDWLTPTLNGAPWFEKPILAYWLAMPTVSMWHNEFGARLPSVLTTLGTAYVVWRFVSARLGHATGQLATLVLTGSMLTAGVGRMMMTDAPFVLCLSSAFLTYYESFTRDQRWRLATAALLGLAVLAKGPVALILFALVAGISAWKFPDHRPQMKRYWLVGTLILSGVLATWYLPAWLVHRGLFVQKFLIEQNLQRFGGGDRAHAAPAWMIPIFFPAIILVCFAWWLAPAFRAKWVTVRETDDSDEGKLRRYLWIWGIVVVGFFSLSGSKLPHYIMPALVPLAVILADAIMKRHPCSHPLRFWLNYGLAWNVILCVILNLAMNMYTQQKFHDAQELALAASSEPEPFGVYTRPNEGKQFTFTTDAADTSQPSIYFYYRRKAMDIGKIQDFSADNYPAIVLTRDDEFLADARKQWGDKFNGATMAVKGRWSIVKVFSIGE